MRSRRAVRGLAGRLLQVANRVARIEVIEERSVVQERMAASALRVPRYLAAVQRKIGVSGNRDAGHAQRCRDLSQNRTEAAGDVRQLRTRNERDGDGVVQATWAEDDGATA